jgi:phage/conjugal plasmid C-4 type zinc finger TraR family protein
MTDLYDMATEVEEGFRAQALAAQRALAEHARARDTAGPTAYVCVDCGDDIPAARRAALPSCRRCVDCQERHERGARR